MKKVYLPPACGYCGSINGHVIDHRTKFHCLECGETTMLVIRVTESYDDII